MDFLCPECGAEYQVKSKAGALGAREFTLREFYDRFEEELAARHPANRNVEPKIRQQLQVLRDRGIVRFLGRGRYGIEQ